MKNILNLKIVIILVFFLLLTTGSTQDTESAPETPTRPVQTIGVVQTQVTTEQEVQVQEVQTNDNQANLSNTTENTETIVDIEPVVKQTVEPVLPNPTVETQTTDWWRPTPNTTWQWQISSPYDDGEIETSLATVQMFDVDLFDTPQVQIDDLKARGIKVVCYFSAGTWEAWREDIVQLERRFAGDPKLEQVKGNRMPWPEEWWLNPRHPITRALMESRLDYAVARGCDGVEPDNVDAWTNDLAAFPNATQAEHTWSYNIPEWPCVDPPFLDEIETKGTGFNLTAEDQLDYNKWMALAAHERRLSIGLKNNGAQVLELEPYYDWSLAESCYDYSECHDYDVFIKSNKAVFMTQYVPDCVLKDGRSNSLNAKQSIKPELLQGMTDSMTLMCADAKKNQFSLLVKRYDLQAWNLECSDF